jgi:hypothetical protein
MAGPLKTHPYYKTYDELQRCIKRMENYILINKSMLDITEINRIQRMIEHMQESLNRIPEEYHVTKYKQYQEKRTN